METGDSRSEEAILVEVERLARTHARAALPADSADDIAHDVVLEMLRRLRAGFVVPGAAELSSLVRKLVRGRRLDQLRRETRQARHEAEYARQRYRHDPAWMSPEATLDDIELERFHQKTLMYLPPACRRAYMMVRDGHTTYEAAAQALAVSPRTIGCYVFTAQREFRRALEAAGIPVPRVRRRRRAA